MEDRYAIMHWRNEQMYHLRQDKILTQEDQDQYFTEVVLRLFDREQPEQILFSYLEGTMCIGYGGLVHINWKDLNAEISFIMDTSREKEEFEKHWSLYLKMIEEVAFTELKFHKLYTYAFDLRPVLYDMLIRAGYNHEARLKEHVLYQGQYIDVVINSKLFEQN
jgi:RimJ/RimL family protein N-acetyltransferase